VENSGRTGAVASGGLPLLFREKLMVAHRPLQQLWLARLLHTKCKGD